MPDYPINQSQRIPENLTEPESNISGDDIVNTLFDDVPEINDYDNDEYPENDDEIDEDDIPIEDQLNDDETFLYTGEIVKFSDDLIHTHEGYAKPDDPNLTKDYFTDCYILKNNSHPIICNYPIAFSELKYVRFNDDAFQKGYIIIESDNNKFNFYLGVPDLLKNSVFTKYYAEDYYTGIFKLKAKIKPFEKRMRINGIKFNCNNNFNTANLPTTYYNTYNKKYSFGLEIETISGLVPSHVLAPLNCSSVHDGSLRDTEDNHPYGKEYVTDVLIGDRGLFTLKKLCNELTKRCLVNHQCGVHVHLSNINFNKENIVLMYYLYTKLQREIFTMLPKSRRNNAYCKFLPKSVIEGFDVKQLQEFNRNFVIDYHYENIVKYISANASPNRKINKKHDHPQGYKCGYDHDSARYCWVNFVPALFNTRKNNVYTIEFRPAPGSTSYFKIKNWLLICMALVDIVENHKRFIYENNNITVSKILTQVYGPKAVKLIAWFDKRVAKFSDVEFNENDEYFDNEVDDNVSLKNL